MVKITINLHKYTINYKLNKLKTISKDHLRVNPFLATFVNREDNEEAEICYDSDVGCFSSGFEILNAVFVFYLVKNIFR